MKVSCVSFTANGSALNRKITDMLLEDHVLCSSYTMERYAAENQLTPLDKPLNQWVEERFYQMDALVFIGACGIAVRAIAPCVKDKKTDPAVIVIDERGTYAISLLSGHIGGANELTLKIAHLVDAIPVITTGTDVNRTFAVDVFARKSGLYIDNMFYAKKISALILDKEPVGFTSDFPVKGSIPEALRPMSIQEVYQSCVARQMEELMSSPAHDILVRAAGIDVCCEDEEESSPLELGRPGQKDPDTGIYVTLGKDRELYPHTLHLIPRVVHIGVGCRRYTSADSIEKTVLEVLSCHQISVEAVVQVSSIDLKKDEDGLQEFCSKYGLPFLTYSAAELQSVPGDFTESDFVQSVTGVSNVCERAALFGAGLEGGKAVLIQKKMASSGVTVALALEDWSVSFE